MLVPALLPVMTVGLKQTITWITTDLLSIRPIGTNFIFQSNYYEFRSWKWFWKYHMQNSGHFVSAAMCYQLFYEVSSWVPPKIYIQAVTWPYCMDIFQAKRTTMRHGFHFSHPSRQTTSRTPEATSHTWRLSVKSITCGVTLCICYLTKHMSVFDASVCQNPSYPIWRITKGTKLIFNAKYVCWNVYFCLIYLSWFGSSRNRN